VIPHAFQQLAAFNLAYNEPIDVTTCVDRFPPNDAPCPRNAGKACCFPFCPCLFYTPDKEDE
jgi:hypothetical protein